ncbi:MAG: WbqC family protein [Acidiferrobacteraceae bacterium]
MRVAIMQPYFMPYAGYFRLFAAADLFVVYDCVQFPRRGWVHRNRFTDSNGTLQWLTLPVEKGAQRTTLIRDLRFRTTGLACWPNDMLRFPALQVILNKNEHLAETLKNLNTHPVEYIVSGLMTVAQLLGIDKPIVFSSSMHISENIRAQDRIIAIARYLGAHDYINAPGGRALYDPDTFQQHGLRLGFLSDYHGPHTSILERLATEPPIEIASEIKASLSLDWRS